MLSHVSIGVRDVDRAKRFYDEALRPLGYTCIRAARSTVGYGYGADTIFFWIVAAERPVPADEKSGLHFCFAALTPAAVDAFYAAALQVGAATTASRACDRSMAKAITPPLSSIPTATGSRPIAARARGDQRCYLTEIRRRQWRATSVYAIAAEYRRFFALDGKARAQRADSDTRRLRRPDRSPPHKLDGMLCGAHSWYPRSTQ